MAFTYFWRDLHTLKRVSGTVSNLLKSNSEVTIWDAGCAMGPEPYTLIMLLAESLTENEFSKIKMIASDYNLDFKNMVNEAEYNSEDISRVPTEYLKKYFHINPETGLYKVNQTIRDKLNFYHHDLLTLKPILKNIDLILCKNVLLHFQQEQRVEVLKMFHSSLKHNGYLATEQTQKIPSGAANLFEQVVSDTQLHKKK